MQKHTKQKQLNLITVNEEARNLKIKEMGDKINLLSNSLSNIQSKQNDYSLISSSISDIQNQIIEIKKQLLF